MRRTRVLAPLWLTLAALMTCALAPLGCGSGDDDKEPTLLVDDITLDSLQPALLLPGSRVVLRGNSFAPDFAGVTQLIFSGSFEGQEREVSLPVAFVDYDEMSVTWPGGNAVGFGGDVGRFVGTVRLSIDSALDGLTHRSRELPVDITLANELQPQLDALQDSALFINDPIEGSGAGFLLGGTEGQTYAVVDGCYTALGSSVCQPLGPVEVAATPVTPFDRSRVTFPFSPTIAGIQPGSFQGSVSFINRHANGAALNTAALPAAHDIIEATIFNVMPAAASLGQYVNIAGGGFVGSSDNSDPGAGLTTIELSGTFTPAGGQPSPAQITMVPEFSSGQLVRYVVNEEDDLGTTIDLRTVTGSFQGTAVPVVQYGNDTVNGADTAVVLEVSPVKQVVWLRYLPSYVESLRHFGLRAMDGPIRERIRQVVERDYAGVNLELRADKPEDFALFAEVEIAGPDPNGVGLLGYDNTPGKDTGNLRLYDKIGGLNALTQLDGYPGYGGVFVESLFSFSQHPNGFAPDTQDGKPVFDAIFDPFRPDQDGDPVTASEVGSVTLLTSSEACPAGDRQTRIACAVWTLGSIIGATLTHEIAHSLGLADPAGSGFHNTGDWPAALMDAGSARTFEERAELNGQGPESFCAQNYSYLRQILPSSQPDPLPSRQECF